MPGGAEVADEYHSNHVSDLIGWRDKAWQAWRDLEPLLDGSDDWVNVARAERLLQRHKERQQEHKHLKYNSK